MTVITETPIASSVANGVTTVFSHAFTVLQAADLVVKGELAGVVSTYTLGVHYTVSGLGGGSGSITFLAPPANGTIVTRYRDSALQRTTDYQDNGDLLADTLNLDFDRLWLLLQEIFAGGKGSPSSLRVPGGETIAPLPAKSGRALRVLAFDSNGDPLMLVGVDASSAAALQIDLLASNSAVNGAGQIGYGVALAYAAGTVGAKLRERISVADFGADPSGTIDSSAAFNAALAASKNVFMPAGTYLVNLNLAAVRGASLLGAGRDVCTLKNFGAAPVITLDNTGGDCKFNHFSDFRIQNRDDATYTTTDGIFVTGVGSNENDFHTFERLEILDMRHGIHMNNRSVWNTFKDVHCYSNLLDGLHVETTDNISAQTFINCRFGQNGSYGLQVTKNAGDLLAGWSFVGCTFEKNNLCGIRIAGAASGVQAWVFSAPYFEENTKTIAAAAVSPRKANIWVSAASCDGLTLLGASLFGTPDPTPLDHAIYIEDACANCRVSVDGSRFDGAYTVSAVRAPAAAYGWLGANDYAGVINSVPANVVDLRDLRAHVTDSFALTLTGCTTSPTGTARAIRQGSQVTMYLPVITGTSNTTAATLTGLPAALAPVRTQTVIARVVDAGSTAPSMIEIDAAGLMTLRKDVGGGSFTNTGAKGVALTTITYSLD
jgi:hypothetical protein